MKVITVSRGFTTKVENLKNRVLIWEAKDGYHPVQPDSVYEHKHKMHKAIILIYDGIICPYGSPQSVDFVNQITRTIDMSHSTHIRYPVSKMFGRMLAGLSKYFGMLIVLILIAWVIASGG